MRMQVAPDRGEFVGKGVDAFDGGHNLSIRLSVKSCWA
jgi:hypothetical protein